MKESIAFRAKLSDQLMPFDLDVNLVMTEPGVTALIGVSGSGKTSLLDAIAGFRKAAGEIFLGAKIWQDTSKNLFHPTHKRRLGYTQQAPYLFPHKSVRQNLLAGYERLPPKERRYHPESVIAGLGIGHLLTQSPHRLSGGERQRVALGRSLLSSPKLWLLDEPLSSLDRQGKHGIIDFLASSFKEQPIPVIYVSHSLSEVCRMAQNVAILESGKLVFHGPIEEASQRRNLPISDPHSEGVLLIGRIAEVDAKYSISLVETEHGPSLWVPDHYGPIGSNVALEILAKDISISMERPVGTSILNCIPCVIEHVLADDSGKKSLLLRSDRKNLVCTITLKSFDSLKLRTGMAVYAQIKAVAVL